MSDAAPDADADVCVGQTWEYNEARLDDPPHRHDSTVIGDKPKYPRS